MSFDSVKHLTIYQVRCLLSGFAVESVQDEVVEVKIAQFDAIFNRVKRKTNCDYITISDADLEQFVSDDIGQKVPVRMIRPELVGYLERQNKRKRRSNRKETS